MTLLRQVASFGTIGVCATATHVGVAWTLMHFTSVDPYLANFAGALSAFFVAFLGNARFTFGVRERLGYYAGRYLLVSAASLFLTTLELRLVENWGLSAYVYVVVVVLTVPPATFLFAKLWAFAPQART